MHYSTGYFVFARALRSDAAARPKTATQDKDPAGVRGRGGEACFVAEDSHRRYNAAGTGAEVVPAHSSSEQCDEVPAES